MQPKDGILLLRRHSTGAGCADVFALYDRQSGRTHWIPIERVANIVSLALRLDESKVERSDAVYARDFERL